MRRVQSVQLPAMCCQGVFHCRAPQSMRAPFLPGVSLAWALALYRYPMAVVASMTFCSKPFQGADACLFMPSLRDVSMYHSCMESCARLLCAIFSLAWRQPPACTGRCSRMAPLEAGSCACRCIALHALPHGHGWPETHVHCSHISSRYAKLHASPTHNLCHVWHTQHRMQMVPLHPPPLPACQLGPL